jgi:hypothetical protein
LHHFAFSRNEKHMISKILPIVITNCVDCDYLDENEFKCTHPEMKHREIRQANNEELIDPECPLEGSDEKTSDKKLDEWLVSFYEYHVVYYVENEVQLSSVYAKNIEDVLSTLKERYDHFRSESIISITKGSRI